MKALTSGLALVMLAASACDSQAETSDSSHATDATETEHADSPRVPGEPTPRPDEPSHDDSTGEPEGSTGNPGPSPGTGPAETTAVPDDDGDDPDELPDGMSFQEFVWPLLAARCDGTGCHQDGGGAAGLNLDEATAYTNVMAYESIQLADMRLIRRFQPEDSYFFHKLRGTHENVGGYGELMPIGGSAYSASELQVFEQWILEGASP